MGSMIEWEVTSQRNAGWDGNKSEIIITEPTAQGPGYFYAKKTFNVKAYLEGQGVKNITRISIVRVFGWGKAYGTLGTVWVRRENGFSVKTAIGEEILKWEDPTRDYEWKEEVALEWDITSNPIVECNRWMYMELAIFGDCFSHARNLGFTVSYDGAETHEPCLINITVLDSETSLPIEGATVSLLNADGVVLASGKTNAQGLAQIEAYQGFSYLIRVMAWGYEKGEDAISTDQQATISRTIKLVKQPIMPSIPWWGWLIGGLVVLGLILYFARGRITRIPTYIIEKVRGE
jgi:hypothetical protein